MPQFDGEVVIGNLDMQIVTGIEGLDELEEAFVTGGNKRAVYLFLKRVELDAAQILVKSAQGWAPYRTGDLEGDIHRHVFRTNDGVYVRVGPSQDTFYGLIQEFGSPKGNIPALHWLYNSAVEVQDEVLEKFYTGVTEGLEAMKK